MLIYKAEKAFRDKILQSMSVAHYCPVEISEKPTIAKAALENLPTNINFNTPASPDLFHTRAILVSTGVNKNDDFFHPLELWNARHTPVDKPTNLNHDPKINVGHITSQWTIGADGTVLEDDMDVEDLPTSFHIATGAVVYIHPVDEDLREQAQLLIEEVKAGTKFVSMETFFRGFDYAIEEAEGQFTLVERNSDTAFLTKHLRAYGGDGLFNGVKIARVLRNIVFSGKGYVDKPANPNSIIFDSGDISQFSFAKTIKVIENKENVEKEEKNDGLDCNNSSSKSSGVYINCEDKLSDDKNTSDVNLETKIMAIDFETENRELKAELKSLREELASAKQESAVAELNTCQTTVQSLTAELDETKAELAKAQEELKSAKAENQKVEEAKACMCKQYDEVVAEKDSLAAKLAEFEKKNAEAARIEALKAKGRSDAEAKEIVDELANVDDATFATIIKRFDVKTAKQVEPKVDEAAKAELEKEDKNKDEKVEVTIAAAVDSEGDKSDKARETLRSGVASHLSSHFKAKTKSKATA